MANDDPEPSGYLLLDAGDGRQLARFGSLIVDRPYPAAIHPIADPAAWAAADLRYERPSFGGAGEWIAVANEVPDAWTMRYAGVTFELRATASGQVGFFGEQVDLWRWVGDAIHDLGGPGTPPPAVDGTAPAAPPPSGELPPAADSPAPPADPPPTGELPPAAPLPSPASPPSGELPPAADPPAPAADPPAPVAPPPTVLNLFAYTGGSTLAAALSGAAVTHVDASRSAVAWARRNAALSGLADAPIRWIVDDALAFVGREARRGRRYDGIVLDPPSYGHGPNGERWTIDQHLPTLLDACLSVAAEPGFVLLTAHAEGMRPQDAEDALCEAFIRAGRRRDAGRVEGGALELRAESGVSAPAGVYARWRSAPPPGARPANQDRS